MEEMTRAEEAVQNMTPGPDSTHNGHPKISFGRLVDGCPRCEWLKMHPEASIRKTQTKRKMDSLKIKSYLREEAAKEAVRAVMPEIEARALPQSYAEMQKLMEAMAKQQAETMKEFARELKAPDPETAAKQAAEKERLLRLREAAIERGRIEEEAKAARQANCSHLKENGKSAIYMGQLFSDMHFHPMCHHCGKELPPVPANAEMIAGAV